MIWTALLVFFPLLAFGQKWKDHHLVSGRSIFSMQGKLIRSFPGQRCLFLDDGSFLSGGASSLRLINKNSEVVWELKGHYHHQMNLSADKKRILALSSHVTKNKSGNLREDKFQIIDLNGKVIHEQNASALFSKRSVPPFSKVLNRNLRDIVGAETEISHFNSIYEVPSVSGKEHPAYIKEGNIVINGVVSGIFVLSPDLKKILHYFTVKESLDHSLHDVQVNEKGNLLIYNNRGKTAQEKFPQNYYTNAAEIRPETGAVIHKFEAEPKEIFYSKISGSIQELDGDTWLITHYLSGSFIYSKSKKKFLSSIRTTHFDQNNSAVPTQQTKSYDLSKFLKHWKVK